MKDGRCRTCNWFGPPGNHNSLLHKIGACGHPRVKGLADPNLIVGELGDGLVYYNGCKGFLNVGFDFGCIHYKYWEVYNE